MLIIRGWLKQLTPNQVLGDVMTQETYHVERDGVDKDEKKEDEDKKKKSVAFKASSSSKNKGKSKKQESSDDEDASDIDDEDMALFVRKFGKFMKKKGYGCRRNLVDSLPRGMPMVVDESVEVYVIRTRW